jgi:hypothetical protein
MTCAIVLAGWLTICLGQPHTGNIEFGNSYVVPAQPPYYAHMPTFEQMPSFVYPRHCEPPQGLLQTCED